MPRSTLFIIVKYSIFVNWTLTGFWIIYNSQDYSYNAQVVSEVVSGQSSNLHVADRSSNTLNNSNSLIEKASVVYLLIAYTICTSFVSFFGLVGVCYENYFLTVTLSVCYSVYTIIDIVFNMVIGVEFGIFLIVMYMLLATNSLALIYMSFLLKENRSHNQQEVNYRV